MYMYQGRRRFLKKKIGAISAMHLSIFKNVCWCWLLYVTLGHRRATAVTTWWAQRRTLLSASSASGWPAEWPTREKNHSLPRMCSASRVFRLFHSNTFAQIIEWNIVLCPDSTIEFVTAERWSTAWPGGVCTCVFNSSIQSKERIFRAF